VTAPPDPTVLPSGQDGTTAADDGAAPPWHALESDEVLARLSVDPRQGLEDDEVARRRAAVGPNELTHDEPRSVLSIVVSQFASPLIVILLVAFVVTILLDELTDAAVIAAVLAINTTIGAIQEHKADRSVHALMQLAAPRSLVVRQGRTSDVPSTELVPGDIVLLSSGSRVPADLRLVAATRLELDESLLTGESLPARATTAAVGAEALPADRSCIAFMGSSVTSGRGRGVVVATAARTQLGEIAESIRAEQRPQTPLQRRMHRFANIIAVAVMASTLVAFTLGLAVGEPLETMFLTAVALAVAVIPEGLPVAFTIAMALGVRRMSRRDAIVRSLPAVETLGSTDVIGTDKTGTLTQNRMTVVAVWTSDGLLEVDEHTAAGPPAEGSCLDRALRSAVLSNEAELHPGPDGTIHHRGDPTESALLVVADRLGADHRDHRDGTTTLSALPFESERRYSSVLTDEGGPVHRVVGAPERVLQLCTEVARADGDAPLDATAILAVVEDLAARGLRVLATADRRLPPDSAAALREDADAHPVPEAMVLTGLFGLQDPPRPGVSDAIARCRHAGIRVVMITGDHVTTARAIGEQLGIGDARTRARTGVELERMTDAELRAVVLETDVFARVTPEHKLRVVHALHAHDRVVAVTGDGVNDGPALKAADIGVAMGRDGTDVAREASDMVLTDDDFVSIAAAVEEGRVVFDNVRKVTYFLLSTGSASIVAIILSIAARLPLPYVPAALLWLNVVTNGLQDVALAFEPGEPDVLDRPPRGRDEGIVSAALWIRTAMTGTALALGSLWLYTWALDTGLTLPQARGAALTTLVVAMAAHAYTARSERRSIVHTRVAGNRFLLASTAVSLGIHLSASAWPPMQRVLQIGPVTGPGWARIAVVTLGVVLVAEAHKALLRRRDGAGAGPAVASTRVIGR
jgi:calcium-translocating P-type ATPase